MGRDPSVSVFVISVAAQLSALHPQTLRNYERQGLLSPERSSGGNRMYSEDDLARLASIAELNDQGLNVTGIKMVLDLQAQVERLSAENESLRAQLPPARRFTR